MNQQSAQTENLRNSDFFRMLTEFGMGQLKYMHRLIRTNEMIHYYGPNQAKIYRDLIYDYIVSRKVRGIECEVWE